MDPQKKRKWLRIAVIAGGLVAVAWFGYDPGVSLCGNLQARWDIAKNQPRYLNYGELAPHEQKVCELLRQRYGIHVERVGSCAVTHTQRVRAVAYNRVVTDRFGFTGERDIFLSTVDELMR